MSLNDFLIVWFDLWIFRPVEKKPLLSLYTYLIYDFLSHLGKSIEELSLEIQAGFYFKGTLRILDVEVFAEININTDPESLRIFANITMTPISWVGGKNFRKCVFVMFVVGVVVRSLAFRIYHDQKLRVQIPSVVLCNSRISQS